jgi:mediator of RNA polymerase II transcription subunit 22
MADSLQTDVARRAALPTANLGLRSSQHAVDESSKDYLDRVEEEWNDKVDVEIQTLADGMVDLVNLASVR